MEYKLNRDEAAKIAQEIEKERADNIEWLRIMQNRIRQPSSVQFFADISKNNQTRGIMNTVERKPAICGVCPGGCAIIATLERGRLIKAEPDSNRNLAGCQYQFHN
jgi:hypothetical protein